MVTSKLDLPKPESLRQPGERLEGQTHVIRKKHQAVHIPPTLEGALKNHIYTRAIDDDGNELMAYVEVPFDPAANEYPKVLYHPEWGKEREPNIADYAGAASTPAQYEAALKRYKAVHDKWERGNRTRTCEDRERENELRKIGWCDYKDLKHLAAAETKAESD